MKMSSKDTKMEKSELEALRKEAEFYRNLIKQHESKQSSMKSYPTSRKIHPPVSNSNRFSQPPVGSSFYSTKLKTNVYSSQPAVKANFIKNRTVIQQSHVSVKNSVVPLSLNTDATKIKNNAFTKNQSLKRGGPYSLSNVPKQQFKLPSANSGCIPKPPKSATCIGKAKNDLLLLKQRSNSNSKVLINEIVALTNKLKEASKTAVLKPKSGIESSSSKTELSQKEHSIAKYGLCTMKPHQPSPKVIPGKIFINPLFSRNNSSAVAKMSLNIDNHLNSSSPKSLVKKGVEIVPPTILHHCLTPLIAIKMPSMQRTISSKTAVGIPLAIALKNSVSLQKSNVKTPLNVKRTPGAKSVSAKKTRLVSSKFKLVNKKPTLTTKSTDVKQVDNIHKLPLPNSITANKGKLKLVSSKYKIVNKKSPVSMRRNSLKLVSPKSPRTRKNVFISKNQKIKINKVTPVKSITNSRYSKNFKNVKPTSKTPRSISSLKRSKYKLVNETRASNSTKKKVVRIGTSSKVLSFSSDIDVDLLMELAAEKKSQSVATPKPRKFLLKRVYKTKNMLVNKNVSSPQVKTAQMIKSKYLATNKRHTWLKQASSRKVNRHSGSFKRPTNFYTSASYQSQRNSVKHSRYTSSVYSKNFKRMHYVQRVSNFASHKSFKRLSGNHFTYRKMPLKKYSSSPVSKILASRVLQHSINRALTASSKKTSKANIYCMFYNRFGRCNKGTKCMYIHDPSKIAICTRFLRGTCKKENCPFSHEISPGKMAICSFYLSGSCTNTKCPYRHEMLKPGAQLCKAFVKGYCPKGKQCQKAHVLICPDYVQGTCTKGNACAFPHPPPKEKKANIEKVPIKLEDKDSDELLMERVSRYFEPSKGEPRSQDQCSSNLVVPQRITLPEQPSFISLSLSDTES